ncbi:MAG: molybdenum cofactor guanylyltransferase [Gammaproteobacteria bacterium]|nr:molybdenum cofactor guanylyltransferase [Gammaproteobacteria bacterium]
MLKPRKPAESDNLIVGIVLAGGAGRRVGGLDKGLVNYQGRPLISWVIDALEPQTDDLLISINRNAKSYSQFGYQLVTDPLGHRGYQGPLAGIVASFAASPQGLDANYLISSCDTPDLPPFYVSQLNEELSANGLDAAVVHDGERRQNLHCLISGLAMPSLTEFFNSGGRAMHQWLDENNTGDVDFSDRADCFSNLNVVP